MRSTDIHAYADRMSVRPGETIEFKVSCETGGTYRADLVRMINPDTNPAGPAYKEVELDSSINGEYAARKQRTNVGSHVVVPDPDGRLVLGGPVVLSLFVQPTVVDSADQALLSRCRAEDSAGYALTLRDGCLAFAVGDGERSAEVVSQTPLAPWVWYSVAVAYDPGTGSVEIVQEPAVNSVNSVVSPIVDLGGIVRTTGALDLRPADSATPFAIAGTATRSGDDWVGDHFNGKIEAPKVLAGTLDEDGFATLARGETPTGLETIAAWDFAAEITEQGVPSDRVTDAGPHGLHGACWNTPTRAVTGRWWNGRDEWFVKAPEQYAAIHFHETDLDDCRWETDIALTVPGDLASDCYALRLRLGASEEYVPFFVLPPAGKATADLLVLMPTATYLAYANGRSVGGAFSQVIQAHPPQLDEQDLYLLTHPELGRSAYMLHRDFSGVCYSTAKRPILNMRPKRGGYDPWGYVPDMHLVDWLNQMGIAYDVATDHELHREGADLLRRYRAVVNPTHPEYYSAQMLDAWETYLGEGGRGLYLGGNGFYWVTAFPENKPHLIELRRGEYGTRTWQARPGEYYLASTGERGGLWRGRARAPQKLFGIGSAAHGFDFAGPFHPLPPARDPRAAFIMEGIDPDAPIGDGGLVGGGASGLEMDRYELALGTPPSTLLIAASDGVHSDNYQGFDEELMFPHPANGASENANVRGDIVYFTTRDGGGVFAAGSMTWCSSLSHNDYDNAVSRMTRNVIERFLDPAPLP